MKMADQYREQGRKEVRLQILEWFEEHRKKSVLTCQEDCFCWDLQIKFREVNQRSKK